VYLSVLVYSFQIYFVIGIVRVVGEVEIAMDELDLKNKIVEWFPLKSYATSAPLLDVLLRVLFATREI
jgi:hypothetical protein